MLEIIEYGKDEYEFPALVVLGCFDAIHAGHRELLKKAKLQAKINGLDLGVMMFRDGKSGKLVYSFEERCAILEGYNVKFVLAVDFNEEFMSVAPLDFLHEVEEKINVKAYMSGKDFRFGAKAKGKSSTLKSYAEDEENGVWYAAVKDVDLNGEKISTTLIKACLDEGNVAKANELLGSEFSVSGEVVKGAGRGTSVVGFPTVNIVYPEWKHPLKHGVYSVKCLVGDTDYQGIANFGTCPTFGDERVALEVYLEGFSGDLYGQILTIRFVDYIRDIEEFGSAEELSDQLENDLHSVSDELAATEEEPVAADEAVAVEETVVEEPAVSKEAVAEVAETAEEVVEEKIEEPEQPIEEVVEEQIEEPEQPAEELSEEQPVEEVDEVVTEEQPEEIIEEITQPSEEEKVEEDVAVEEVFEEGFDDYADDGLEEQFETSDEESVTEEQPEELEQPIEEVVEEQIEVQPESPAEEVEEAAEVIETPVEEQVEEQHEESDAEEMKYTEGEESAVSDASAEEEPQPGEEASEETSDGEEN